MRQLWWVRIYRCDDVVNGIYEWGKARGIDHHLPYLGISSIYLFAVSPVMTPI